MSTPSKKVLYIDMDNTLVDFESGIAKLSEAEQQALLTFVIIGGGPLRDQLERCANENW